MTITTLATCGHWGFWPVLPFLWFVFWGGLVAAFVLRRRRWYPSGRGQSLLAERFASGDITEAEYRTRLAVLQETR